MISKISVVVGGQFGSEAKGAVTAWLTRQSIRAGNQVAVVRVAGPNAGHTAYDAEGRKWALRQIPVGMVVDPDVTGWIAAGSEVDLRVLCDEIKALREAGIEILGRLYVDNSATLLTAKHVEAEHDAGINARIGSTAKGIGAARADRLMRTAFTMRDIRATRAWLNEQYPDWTPEIAIVASLMCCSVVDTLKLNPHPRHVIIEGTQGYGLGLHTKYYPQTTSQDCRAIDFLAQAGLSPWEAANFEVWICARIYPIRVAGNSGPLLDETTWEELGLPPEVTTVTKKTRRVGQWDGMLVKQAVRANGGPSHHVKLAITMADQAWPDLAGEFEAKVPDTLASFLQWVQHDTGAKIGYIGTGPNSQIVPPAPGDPA